MTHYESVEGTHRTLDAYLATYNPHRPHRRRGMEGWTPHYVLKKGIRQARRAGQHPPKRVNAAV